MPWNIVYEQPVGEAEALLVWAVATPVAGMRELVAAVRAGTVSDTDFEAARAFVTIALFLVEPAGSAESKRVATFLGQLEPVIAALESRDTMSASRIYSEALAGLRVDDGARRRRVAM